MSKNIKHQQHTIRIDEEFAYLTAYTKKKKPVEAIIDVADLKNIKKYDNWRAVWSTEHDSAIIEHKKYEKNHATRLSLASIILSCSPNAPIRHKNGNLLDNRRQNLEIFDLKNHPNEIITHDDTVEIKLKDRYGKIVGSTIIDKSDQEKILNNNEIWIKKKRSSGQPYVVNLKNELLSHKILGVVSGYVLYLNKNPLDNRRNNIRIEEEKQ